MKTRRRPTLLTLTLLLPLLILAPSCTSEDPVDPPPDPPPAPSPLLPADQQIFDNVPRTTTLTWTEVSSALRYRVQVESGTGCTTSPIACQDWTLIEDQETVLERYTFEFPGAQPGRWRVRSQGLQQTHSDWTAYRHFLYTQ